MPLAHHGKRASPLLHFLLVLEAEERVNEVRLDAHRIELNASGRVLAALLAAAARKRRTIHLIDTTNMRICAHNYAAQ